MKKEETRGGKRTNSGRNPLPDNKKKKPVAIWIEEYKIDALGGSEEVKLIMTRSVKEALAF